MGALHRAVLYLRRKPGKAVILAAVMAVACGMALLSLGILETTRTLSTGLKQAAVPVAAVYAADGRGIVGEELAAQLAELPSVKGANRLRAVDATPANFANIEGTLADPGFDDAVRLNAFDDLASDSPFSDQLVRLVEGALVTSEDEHAAVVHVDLAEANGLGLGDRVAFAGENGERAEARIVGLYAAAGGNESGAGGVTARDQSFNQIYVDNVTAADLGAQGFTEVRLTLADADRADDAIADIQRTCGNGFATEIYDSTLSQLAPSLDQTSAAAQATLALVALTGTAAATMLLALWGRSRVRERAVLLSLGRTRAEVACQSLAESTLLFVVAVAVATGAALLLFPAIADALVPPAALLAAETADAAAICGVSTSDAALVALAGFAVVATATGTCTAVSLRRNPRDLLTDKA